MIQQYNTYLAKVNIAIKMLNYNRHGHGIESHYMYTSYIPMLIERELSAGGTIILNEHLSRIMPIVDAYNKLLFADRRDLRKAHLLEEDLLFFVKLITDAVNSLNN